MLCYVIVYVCESNVFLYVSHIFFYNNNKYITNVANVNVDVRICPPPPHTEPLLNL